MRWREAGVGAAAVAVLMAGCSSSASPSPSVNLPETGSQEPSAVMSTEPSASPAAADPRRFAFTEDYPTVTAVSTETDAGVTVTDLTFTAGAIEPTEAFLVTPEAGEPGPALIWFHWIEAGDPSSNRTEFLEEAKGLARRGAVSLLVQGRMPWIEPPESIAHDVPVIEEQVRMLWTGLLLLDARDEVDNTRYAVVGHDFGGMYQSLFFGAEHHLNGMVLMAPTARWADWFYRYWEISDPEAEYTAALAGLDPVTWLPLADDRPVLLQFASNDQYVPETVAEEITAAAGETAESRTYVNAGHTLNDEARIERDAWLAELLGLPPAN